jgi:hypothetical protein
MEAAVNAVKVDGMPYREASRHYNVPLETLRGGVIGIVEMGAKSGPPTIFNTQEEDLLSLIWHTCQATNTQTHRNTSTSIILLIYRTLFQS